MTDDSEPARVQALDRLAAALDPREFATTLTTFRPSKNLLIKS